MIELVSSIDLEDLPVMENGYELLESYKDCYFYHAGKFYLAKYQETKSNCGDCDGCKIHPCNLATKKELTSCFKYFNCVELTDSRKLLELKLTKDYYVFKRYWII